MNNFRELDPDVELKGVLFLTIHPRSETRTNFPKILRACVVAQYSVGVNLTYKKIFYPPGSGFSAKGRHFKGRFVKELEKSTNCRGEG